MKKMCALLCTKDPESLGLKFKNERFCHLTRPTFEVVDIQAEERVP